MPSPTFSHVLTLVLVAVVVWPSTAFTDNVAQSTASVDSDSVSGSSLVVKPGAPSDHPAPSHSPHSPSPRSPSASPPPPPSPSPPPPSPSPPSPPPPPPSPPPPPPPSPPPPPPHAHLADLYLSEGKFIPQFDLKQFEYTAEVDSWSFTITPVLSDDKSYDSAVILVNEVEVANYTRSQIFEIPKNTKTTKIFITISNPGWMSSTYSIKIDRVSHWTFWTVFLVVLIVFLIILSLVALAFWLHAAYQQKSWPFGNNVLRWPWAYSPEGQYTSL